MSLRNRLHVCAKPFLTSDCSTINSRVRLWSRISHQGSGADLERSNMHSLDSYDTGVEPLVPCNECTGVQREGRAATNSSLVRTSRKKQRFAGSCRQEDSNEIKCEGYLLEKVHVTDKKTQLGSGSGTYIAI